MMAKSGALSVTRKLERELKHRLWMQKNLPSSSQLRKCQRRILILRTELAKITHMAVNI